MKLTLISTSVVLMLSLNGCGAGDTTADKEKVIDVTPDTTVIKETEQQVNAALQDSKKALDNAIDSQGGAQ